MKELDKYIIALVNLYGIVHRDKLVEIYNSQNKSKICSRDLDNYFSHVKRLLEDNFIGIYKNYFVDVSFIGCDNFDKMLEKKADKPYYIPEKDELFKYADGIYFEKNKEYMNLLNYIKENFFDGDEKKAERLAGEVQIICRFVFDIQLIIDNFSMNGIVFENIEQANEVTQLIMNVSNNVRLWENNGYTSKELSELFDNYKKDYSYREY